MDDLYRVGFALCPLDQALTGKDWKTVTHTARNKGDLSLLGIYEGELYYLSDGGYSRLFWSDHYDGLILASESRDEVKAAFKENSELVDSANRLIRCAVQAAEAQG